MERRNTEIFNNGNQLLSEELQKAYNGDVLILNDTVERDGVTYKFSKEYNDELEKWKLCISWEDKLSKSIERCGYINGEK